LRGLGSIDAAAGTLIAFATALGKTAEDGDSRNSPFTKSVAAPYRAAREPHVDNNTHISRDSAGSGFGRRFYGMTRVLKQAPYAPHIKVGEIGILLSGYFRR